MKAYIRIIDSSNGIAGWFNDTDWTEDSDTGKIKHTRNGEQYFEYGWDIYNTETDYLRPSPFPNVKVLKQGIKDAKRQWSWDGNSKGEAEIWLWRNGYYKLAELLPDGKFKIIGDEKKYMHAENDKKGW